MEFKIGDIVRDDVSGEAGIVLSFGSEEDWDGNTVPVAYIRFEKGGIRPIPLDEIGSVDD